VAYSPTLSVAPATPTVTLAQGATTTINVTLTNVGTLNIPWAAHRNTSWITAISPSTGSASASAPGQMTLTIVTGSLAVGTYHGGVTFASTSRDLAWPDSFPVTLTVTPGTPTQSGPNNPFGVPDPPDEGSPDGTGTPTGTNVQALAIRDVLVTFPSVTTAGMTVVTASASERRAMFGRSWNPWEFRVSTSAKFTGPVTVAIAYDSTLSSGTGRVRIFDDAGLALTQQVDTTKRIVYATVNSLPATLTVERTPNTDFNDDGSMDLMWQNTSSRQPLVWFLGGAQGTAMVDYTRLSAQPSGWTIVGVQDLNGDGHPDLIWQNDSTGQVVAWYMAGADGTVMHHYAFLSTLVVPDWTIVSVADFDKDGHPDLLWQSDTTGELIVWYMGGASGSDVLNYSWLLSEDSGGWKLAATADLDNDGHLDLIWQHPQTRQVIVWYMSGTQNNTRRSWNFLSDIDTTGWTVVGAADVNKDGHPDLIWQYDGTRQVVVWFMGGAQGQTRSSWSFICPFDATGWRAIAK
jgi:hypothetical protein